MAGLYRDAEEKVRLESRNGAIQAEAVLAYADEWQSQNRVLTPELILELQRLAVNQVYSCAGTFRTGPVILKDPNTDRTFHAPPDHQEVPSLVEEMCAYVRDHWASTPVHLASYLMWRVNWIHPSSSSQ